MNIDLTLRIIKEAFGLKPDPTRPDKEILRLLEITLKRNDFQFAGRIFLQLCGTAMGKDYAPSLANIFLQKFERHAMQDFHRKPELYSRFLDDIFLIWCGTREELMQYQDYLNSLMPGIKVTLCVKHTVTEFLDTLVYKNPTDIGQSELCTRVFFKPTDTHQLLFGSSCHPRHTTKGILKSQILRFKRISSTRIDFDDACTELYAVLKDRGYPRTLYRLTKNTVWFTDFEQEKWLRQANELRENNGVKKEIWPIINYYDPISARITYKTRQVISELKCAENHTLINAFRIHDNLRRKLVKSSFLGANRQ